jgi:exopolysaccharide biosynthesis protein
MRRLHTVLGALLFCMISPSARAEWGNPRGFFKDESIKESPVGPGVVWIAASGTHEGRKIESHLLKVDLTKSGISLGALADGNIIATKSGQFVRRSVVSQWLSKPSCIGGINVAFFDIGSTQATQGLVIQSGRLLRESQAGRPSLLISESGSLALAETTWSGKVRIGAQSRPLAGVNRPQLGADEVALYQNPWLRSPGNTAAFSRNSGSIEILIGPVKHQRAVEIGEPVRISGPVIGIHTDGKSIEIGSGQMVLAVGKSAAPFFRNLKAGEDLSVDWALGGLPSNMPFHQIRDAVSAQPILIRDGKKLPGSGAFWTSRHPRSAVGIHPDGRQVVLLVVDGRSSKSAGMSLESLADYLLHLGSSHAMNLDGGGSSAIGAKLDGMPRILNNPSDGRERAIPTGLGVFLKGG